MICSFSKLESDKLTEIQNLEKEMGIQLLAFSCQDLKTAELNQDQLDKIQEVEKKLSLSLVALSA